jgi:glycerol-3-phosphate dehydrogenase subunit B
VIGAGLAGLSCAAELAKSGASVYLAAKGMATTQWTHGGLDVAAPPGAATIREGVRILAQSPSHPYRALAPDVEPAVAAHLERCAAEGLAYAGSLDSPLMPVPTAVGGIRPAAILPDAQAAALDPWQRSGLLVVGFRHYLDAWPALAVRRLAAVAAAWPDGPARAAAIDVDLASIAERRNLGAQVLARLFDDRDWRAETLQRIAAAVPAGRWRVALPAVLGLEHHAEGLADARAILGRPVFEIPSLPPSVPGLRLFEALRRRILASNGRIQVGFDVVSVERKGRRIAAVHTEAAARTLRLAADAFVLATGGIAGAGLRAEPDGTVVERVFGLGVKAPTRDAWFSGDPLSPHPLEAVGIEVDERMAPAELDNVRVIGSALAGMHYLDERCGDGVALASAHRAARSLASPRAVAA